MTTLIALLTSTLIATLAFADQPQHPTPLTPVRMANAHIQVIKKTAVTAPNPTVKVDVICDVTRPIPVFDLRNPQSTSWYLQTDVFGCDNTVAGEAVTVSIGTAILLSHNRTPLDQADYKEFDGNLWVAAKNSASQTHFGNLDVSGVSAWSHDLGLRSLGLDLQPQVLWGCLEPTPNKPNQGEICSPGMSEWFAASVEFVD